MFVILVLNLEEMSVQVALVVCSVICLRYHHQQRHQNPHDPLAESFGTQCLYIDHLHRECVPPSTVSAPSAPSSSTVTGASAPPSSTVTDLSASYSSARTGLSVPPSTLLGKLKKKTVMEKCYPILKLI